MRAIKQASIALIISAISANSSALTVSALEEDASSEALGLEWIKWTVTAGMSIDEALTAYSEDGWRLATNSEMASLFNKYFLAVEEGDVSYVTQVSYDPPGQFSASEFSDDENILQLSPTSESWINPLLYEFFDVVGILDDSCTPFNNEIAFCVTSTGALYGADLDGDGFYNLASARYEFNDQYGETYGASLGRDIYPSSLAIPDSDQPGNSSKGAGVALVRSLPYNPTPVPEIDAGRSALAFFLLAGLLFWFREQLPIKSIRN